MKTSINVERAKKRMTQRELASKVGCSRQTIHAIESRRFKCSIVLAVRIARFFGLSVEQFEEFNNE